MFAVKQVPQWKTLRINWSQGWSQRESICYCCSIGANLVLCHFKILCERKNDEGRLILHGKKIIFSRCFIGARGEWGL